MLVATAPFFKPYFPKAQSYMTGIFVALNGSQLYDITAYIYAWSHTWQFFPLFDPLPGDQFVGYHIDDSLVSSCGFF